MNSQTHASLSWGYFLLDWGQTLEATLSQILSIQYFIFRKETMNVAQARTQAQKYRDSILEKEKPAEVFWGKLSLGPSDM